MEAKFLLMPKKQNKLYNLVLKTGELEYKSEGETAEKAIINLGVSWNQIKYKGTMKISKDGKSYEHFFYVRQLKKIFANRMMRAIWGRRLEMFLNNK